jgi:hypothetical protein
VRDSGVTLRGAEVVDGVRVSGTFPTEGNVARLRVTGRYARGSLRLTRGGRVTGTLGGRRVSASSARAAGASRALSWNAAGEARRLRALSLR